MHENNHHNTHRFLSKKQAVNILFFAVLFLAYLVVTLFLFHYQTVAYEGRYPSDILPYISKMQGINTGYRYPYPILFWTGRIFLLFTSPQHAMAIALCGLNGLSALLLKYYLDKFLETRQQKPWYGFLSTLLTFSMLFISMLYPIRYLGLSAEEITSMGYWRYLGTFTPNPYHNATYLAARPFTILAFFTFTDLLSTYEEEKRGILPYLAFSVSLLLATLTKPSYTLPAVAVSGLVMAFRLIRSHFQGFRAFLLLGSCFIPTFLALLYQYADVFTVSQPEVETGMGFGFMSAWGLVTDNILLSLIMGLAFPLMVLLFHYRTLVTSVIYRFSWLLLCTSLLMFVFLHEKGYRMSHLNFSWGYMHSMFFVFLTSLIVLCNATRKKEHSFLMLLPQWGCFLLHVIWGVDYFRILMAGGIFL